MPVYPTNPTYVSGFYNNKVVSGQNDRVYSAKDLRMPYSAIFSNGVKPNANGTLGTDLQVQYVSGMQIRVAAGQGMFGGAFFLNKSVYTITLDTAASTDRYDCIIVRADDTENVRNTSIYVKSLTRVPVASDLLRTYDINEYCLGYVKVEALSASVQASNITDTRLNQNLCGVITGVYQQLDGAAVTAQWNSAFYNWFNDIKDAFVSSATLIHTYYSQTISSTANQTRVAIGVPQFNKNIDTLIVSVEGRVFTEGVDYTIYSNAYVDFTIGFPVAGTKVYFQVLKSVDGSNAETVVSQVNTLINQMNIVNNKLEFDYYCNGTNDNILISQLVQSFINGTGRFAGVVADAQLKLNVHGNCGITTPYGGDGTSSSYYRWFSIGVGSSSEKKVTVDFTNCSKVNIPLSGNTYNTIIYGANITVVGMNLKANCTEVGCQVYIFGGLTGEIVAENCSFESITTSIVLIGRNGTFINCKGNVSSANLSAYCFNMVDGGKPIIVIGGEYKAYTGSSIATNISAIVYADTGLTNAVCTMHGVNCPTVAKENFYQKNCLRINSGYITTIGLITALTNSTGAGATASITGTIPISKA